MGKPAPVPMQCAARRYKAILLPPPGSRPRTKSFLLSNSIKLSNPRLTDLRLCPKANVLPSNRFLSEISFSELPSQGSIIRRSEEHTSELQSPCNLVCRLLLEKKKIHAIVIQ